MTHPLIDERLELRRKCTSNAQGQSLRHSASVHIVVVRTLAVQTLPAARSFRSKGSSRAANDVLLISMLLGSF